MTSEELAATIAELVAVSDRTVAIVTKATALRGYCETLVNNAVQLHTYATALVDECDAVLAAVKEADPVTVANRLSAVADLLAQKEAEVPA